MTQPAQQVWQLLGESGLLKAERLQELIAESQSANPPDFDAEATIKWLIAAKAISPYQGRILAAGRSGPFFYEEYKVRDRLTRGDFVGRYQAVHTKTGYPVLLEFATQQQVEDANGWAAITARARKLAEVSHPQFLQFYELVDVGAWKFVVFESRRGPTIASKIEGGKRVNSKNSCHLIRSAAGAVQALHQTGLVHGHLSSSMLFLGTDGNCWVHCDPLVSNADGNSGSAESVEFAAPEVADGGDPTRESDIYSLGCVLFQMLMGNKPFQAEDPLFRLQQQRQGKFASLEKPGLPDKLTQLITSMLSPTPADRPQSMQDVAAVLAEFSGNPKTGTASAPSERQIAFLKRIRAKRAESAASIQPPIEPVDSESKSSATTDMRQPSNPAPVAAPANASTTPPPPVQPGVPQPGVPQPAPAPPVPPPSSTISPATFSPATLPPNSAPPVPVNPVNPAEPATNPAVNPAVNPAPAALPGGVQPIAPVQPVSPPPAPVPGQPVIPAATAPAAPVYGAPGSNVPDQIAPSTVAGIPLPVTGESPISRRRKRRGPGCYAIIGLLTSLLLLAPVVYYVVNVLENDNLAGTPTETGTNVLSQNPDENENPTDQTQDAEPGNDNGEAPINDAEQVANQNVEQHIVEDDGSQLWETPTVGAPLSLQHVPDGIRLIVSARPAELLSAEDGELLMKSLGERFVGMRQSLDAKLGVKLQTIEHLLVTFHDSAGGGAMRASFVVTLTEPIARDQLTLSWGSAVPTALEGKGLDYYLAGDDRAYLIPSDDLNTDAAVRKYIVSSEDQIKAMAQFDFEPPNVNSSIRKLVTKSDAQRHFTLITSTSFLYGNQASGIFVAPYDKVPQTMEWLVGRDVQAMLFSSHLEDDWYSELMLRGQIDRDPRRQAESFSTRVSEGNVLVGSFVSTLRADPYWDQVRNLFSLWTRKLAAETRYGVEDRIVIANNWMPRPAAHNVIAASELLLASSGNAAGSAPGDPAVAMTGESTAVSIPTTLDALLDSVHSVDIPEDDLINAVAEIRTGVLDRYKNALPFDFDIVMMGTALQKDGITQNQKVRNFKVDAPLNEILTRLVVTANPDPNSTGPRDPLNKLIWAVGPDPKNPDRQVVLITTRAAMENAEIALPAAFQPE